VLLISYWPERLLLAQMVLGRQSLSRDFMNTLCQDRSPSGAMSSLSEPQPDPAGSVASQPTGNSPPELERGASAVVIDQAGLIVAAEPICAPLFHWEPAQLVGQTLEVLLLSGADRIRQQLVPDQGSPNSDSGALPRLFVLARRKDETPFAAAVTLRQKAGCWWAVAFHTVNAPLVALSGTRAGGSLPPASTPRRRRAEVGVPLDLDSIPDIFQRAPAKPAPQPEPPATAPAVAPEQPALAARMPVSQDKLAPGAAPAQPAPANPDPRLHELEQRLAQSAEDLQRTRAHIQHQDEQLHTSNSTARQATAALKEETARCTQLEAQLAQARQAGDELNQRLCAEQQTRAESEARLHELEQRLAQSAEDLRCAQAQRPQQPAPSPSPSADEPPLQDQLLELESRFRTTVSSLARTTAELETERGERRRSEQRADTLADQMQQLHEELKNHLASEQIDHQRLTELERQLHEQEQQNDLAAAKLQSALQLEQCERNRLEAELLRSRLLSTDSARAGRALVNSLRRQLQPPVESLHRTACGLLQLQLPDDQKELLQTMLENTLLLESSLQESPEP